MRRFVSFLVAAMSTGALAYGCGSSDNGGASDGGAPDAAATDSPVAHHDSAVMPPGDDAGDDGSSSTACPTPADISTWTPPALKPSKMMPNACSAHDIAAYIAACIATATRTPTSCSAWDKANATCYGCLVSKNTDPTWGPLVVTSGVLNVNAGGCVANLDPANTSCATTAQNAVECTHAACDTVCPILPNDPSGTSFMNWLTCERVATMQGCGMYAQMAGTCVTADMATASVCDIYSAQSPYMSFDQVIAGIAPVFCGGASDGGAGEGGTTEAGPPEGGTDAPSGG